MTLTGRVLACGWAALLAVAAPAAAQETVQRELRESQLRLDQIRREREELQQQMERLRTRVRSVAGELANIERQRSASAGALREGVLPGSADHFVATVGADISRDTRVEVFAPRAGSYVRVAAAVSSGAFGSDFDYRRLSLDARTYRSISPRRVIAAQAAAEAVDGTAPFDLLSRLGGQVILRGYQQARYSDNAKAAAQAELRSHVFWRVGVAVFGGLAAVAPSAGDLPDAPWLAAGGAGLRFNVSQAEGLNLRLDLAWGRRGSALYIGGGDAF